MSASAEGPLRMDDVLDFAWDTVLARVVLEDSWTRLKPIYLILPRLRGKFSVSSLRASAHWVTLPLSRQGQFVFTALQVGVTRIAFRHTSIAYLDLPELHLDRLHRRLADRLDYYIHHRGASQWEQTGQSSSEGHDTPARPVWSWVPAPPRDSGDMPYGFIAIAGHQIQFYSADRPSKGMIFSDDSTAQYILVKQGDGLYVWKKEEDFEHGLIPFSHASLDRIGFTIPVRTADVLIAALSLPSSDIPENLLESLLTHRKRDVDSAQRNVLGQTPLVQPGVTPNYPVVAPRKRGRPPKKRGTRQRKDDGVGSQQSNASLDTSIVQPRVNPDSPVVVPRKRGRPPKNSSGKVQETLMSHKDTTVPVAPANMDTEVARRTSNSARDVLPMLPSKATDENVQDDSDFGFEQDQPDLIHCDLTADLEQPSSGMSQLLNQSAHGSHDTVTNDSTTIMTNQVPELCTSQRILDDQTAHRHTMQTRNREPHQSIGPTGLEMLKSYNHSSNSSSRRPHTEETARALSYSDFEPPPLASHPQTDLWIEAQKASYRSQGYVLS